MTSQPKSTIKTYFVTGAKPTQGQFANLVDSYQDATAILNNFVSAATFNNGIPNITSPTTVTMVSAGIVGLQVLAMNTSAQLSNFVTVIDQAPAFTINANNTAVSANRANITTAQTRTLISLSPTRQTFTSGAGTYTLPAACLYIKIRMVGGGGGGSGSGGTVPVGGNGGNSTFGASLTCNAGSGGTSATFLTGGTATGGDPNITGGSAMGAYTVPANANGAWGGTSAFGGNGPGGIAGANGSAAVTNSGSGGGGGGAAAGQAAGSGGSAGGYLEKIITSPNATYAYVVGAAGVAGTAGSSGFAGGLGGSGIIIVDEFYL